MKLLKYAITLACLIIIFSTNCVEAQALIGITAEAHHKNDTLTVKINICNIDNPSDISTFTWYYYIGLSDFIFLQLKENNYGQLGQRWVLPYPENFVTTISCIQKKYTSMASPAWDYEPYMFDMKFLPKLLEVENGDSAQLLLKMYSPKKDYLDNTEYHCIIEMPFLDNKYSCLLDVFNRINNEAVVKSYEEVELDISNMKYRDFKNNYSKVPLSKNDNKLLVAAFLDHTISITTDVIFED